MTEQFPPFRHSVALRMEGYNERIAARIKRERERRGEEPSDAARRAAVSVRTFERWEAGERKPQLRNLAALAKSWGVPIEKLRPDLEEEAERLVRIEAKLDLLLRQEGLPVDFDAVVQELETTIAEAGRPEGSTGSHNEERPPEPGT